MARYLKWFKTDSEYNTYTADTENFIIPNVSFVENSSSKKVRFTPSESGGGSGSGSGSGGGPIVLTCVYVPTGGGSGSGSGSGSGGGPTQLFYNGENFADSIESMTIDGNEHSSVVSSYDFGDTSEHTVIFTLKDGVTSIGDYAFSNCTSLTSCTIGSGVTSIGYDAFNSCTSLTSIDIPDSVTSIGYDAFNYTPWWNNYSADTSHQYGNIIYINNVAYKATSTNITSATFRDDTINIGYDAFSGCTSLTSITIPDSVTSIGDYAFEYCSSLSSCTIGSGVTSIGGWAFYQCYGLISCTIGSGVTSIGTEAFEFCYSLTSIDIPDSVTSIDAGAFYSCSSLSSCTIGSGVTTIGNGAFAGSSGLTSITIEATTPPTLVNGNAFNNTNNCPIYVPSASVGTYKSSSGWSSYASRIQAIS